MTLLGSIIIDYISFDDIQINSSIENKRINNAIIEVITSYPLFENTSINFDLFEGIIDDCFYLEEFNISIFISISDEKYVNLKKIIFDSIYEKIIEE